MEELLKYARHYKQLGFSVIAIDAAKQCIHSWKKYQYRIITDYCLEKLFTLPRAHGIAIVCGKVSGNLEVIDIDEKNSLEGNLIEQITNKVNSYDPELYARLVIAKSRNNGYHFFYRCCEIATSTHLARRPGTENEISKNPEQKIKVLIETKAEAGYIIAYPTPGYQFIQHDLQSVPVILPSERNSLLEIAKGFNLYNEPQTIFNISHIDYGEASPFKDFNVRGDIITLLERHGWKVVKRRGLKTYFRRPGDTDHETSGDFHHGLGLFGVFTPSTDFIPKKGYSPSAVYAILECQGDFKLAAKRLVEEGYGIPYKNMY